jgi:hypothetical protein
MRRNEVHLGTTLPLVVAGMGAFIILTTLPLRRGVILVPDLIPVFCTPVLLIYLAGQVALCLVLRSQRGLWWIASGLGVGVLFGLVVFPRVAAQRAALYGGDFDPVQGMIALAVSVSGILLGRHLFFGEW